MARLVITHSTYINGLIKWLKKLSEEEAIQTITPATLSKVNSRGVALDIKISRKTNEGYKLIARKGKLAQEIFLVTKLSEESIKELLKKSNPSRSRKGKRSK